MKYTYFKTLILLLCLTPFITMAQNNQQKNNDSILLLIKKYIAQKNTNSIFALGSENYQAKTDKKAFYELLENQIYTLGKIKKSSLISYKSGISKYKIEFESKDAEFSISTTKENKLKGFGITDFVPAITMKPVPAPTSNPMKSKMDKLVDSAARSYIQQSSNVGLAIGVIKDGHNYIYGYGQTQKVKGKVPDANTIFEIGSITKTFTSEILAYYVNQGKISLSDPITKYLPDSVAGNPNLQKIKIVNLSNHTSGIPRLPDNLFNENPDPVNPYKSYTKELLYANLKTTKVNAVPGEVYEYSNQAAGLLGVILENISGKTYEALVKEIIAAPLKMESTFQHLTPAYAKRFVKVYSLSGRETKAWDFDALVAGGGLRSTINDMLAYANSNLQNDGSELAKAIELSHKVTFRKEPNVGLGWHIFEVEGSAFYWHNGGTGGSRTYMITNPDKKIAVVVLSNSEASVDEVATKILDKLLLP